MDTASARISDLIPFVPRLTLEWLRDHPDRLWLERDATIAFVDISGFTAMSEKLSNLGKAGAEEVTDVMNGTFSALLDVAYAEGGGLLKFGGDALLLLYDGPDHAAHAARACFGMRRVLRTVGRPRTSAGAIQLRMHAGLHSGTFQFFLVGDSHRELLITGPASTRTVEMEATSEAGEIVVSAETAALLDPDVLGEAKGDGLLLVGEASEKGEFVPTPDTTGIPLELAIPTPLRAQLLEVGPFEGEHRNGAIAFVRYSGIDEVIRTEGADAAADALDALVRAIQEATDEHGVTFLESDVDKDGGRIILVSGAPVTYGDDEERLLRALRAAVDSGLPLPVHIGANRGRFFTGQVGAPFRRTYTVLGDTAALAARLMARAGEDEVLVSSEAYDRGGTSFEADELEPFMVKGKTEPVQAYALGALAEAKPTAAEPERGGGLPFVDRERERAVLDAAVAPVRMGFGTLVELIGEPGIGKSRLAEELESRCADMGKVATRCQQYESTTPYHPFRPVLRSLLDVDLNGDPEHNRTVLAERLERIDADLVPWAPLFAAPLDVHVSSTPEVDALDPAFWRARLHGVLGRVLGQVLDAPTLMLFEDVHWMDDASSELLRFLGTQLPTKPWLACTTRRPVEGGFAAAEGSPPLPAMTLRLEALPEADAKTLAQAAAGGRKLTDEELEAISQRAAGNPLFLQELAAPDEAEGGAVSETVEALLATKIDRLAPGDRALLRWASVLGNSFSGRLIEQVLEGETEASAASDAWERLTEFVERDPHTPGAFRFRHALIRDAAYEGLSYRRRRELHARVADVIEEHQPDLAGNAELLSLHHYRGEQWDGTWLYSVIAGRRAWAKYANVEAARFYERALEAADQGADVPASEVAQVWEDLGDARMRLGEYEGAGAAYRDARKAFTAGPVEDARLMQKDAIASFRLNKHSQALRRLTQAQRLLGHVEGSEAAGQRARLFSWYAAVLQRQKRPEDVVEWCERAIAEGERASAHDALAHAYFLLDWAYVALARPHEAVYSVRAIAIYEELGDLDRLAWVLNNLGGYTYLEGRWDDALDLAARARDTFRKIGDDTHAMIAALNIAEVRSDQGRDDEAGPVFHDAVELRRAAGIPVEVAEALSLLGRHEARVGNFAEAHAHLQEARELYDGEDDDEFDLLTTEARRIECLVLEGRSDEVLAAAEAALTVAGSVSGASVVVAALHRYRGWAHAQTGDAEAAREAFAESLATARARGENYGLISNDYEVALTLDALVRVERQEGKECGGLEAERDEILARLGVVRLPEPPLPPV